MPIKGATMLLETRRKISDTKRANPYIYTEEVKEKMRQKARRPRPYCIKGQRVRDGYILIYQPRHSRADFGSYVRRADLVMEGMLGRLLEPNEIVDHINRVRDDDNPENLRLFPSRAEHTRFHALNGDLPKPPVSKGNLTNLIPFKKGYDSRRNKKVLPPRKADPLEAKRLYLDEELSLTATAKKLGVGISTVRDYLRSLGVATRSVSEAMKIVARQNV